MFCVFLGCKLPGSVQLTVLCHCPLLSMAAGPSHAPVGHSRGVCPTPAIGLQHAGVSAGGRAGVGLGPQGPQWLRRATPSMMPPASCLPLLDLLSSFPLAVTAHVRCPQGFSGTHLSVGPDQDPPSISCLGRLAGHWGEAWVASLG